MNDVIAETVPFTFPLELLKQVELDGEFHVVGYAATTDFDMQGDIIKYWADRSNELTHYAKGEKRAREKRADQMDPKLDDDVDRAMQDSRNSGYQE